MESLYQAQCIKNLGNVLEEAGSSWEKVVKVNIFLKNMDDFSAVNEVYSQVSRSFHRDLALEVYRTGNQLLPTLKPARSCIQAAKLPGDVDIEIEAIATY